MEITAEYFEYWTGNKPVNDDLERCNYPKAGESGHTSCGWNDEYKAPGFFGTAFHKPVNVPLNRLFLHCINLEICVYKGSMVSSSKVNRDLYKVFNDKRDVPEKNLDKVYVDDPKGFSYLLRDVTHTPTFKELEINEDALLEILKKAVTRYNDSLEPVDDLSDTFLYYDEDYDIGVLATSESIFTDVIRAKQRENFVRVTEVDPYYDRLISILKDHPNTRCGRVLKGTKPHFHYQPLKFEDW